MIVYLIKVMFAMSLCLGLYHLFLAGKKTFIFNRFYLLGSLLLSLEAPFLKIPIFAKESITPLLGLDNTSLTGEIIPQVGIVTNSGDVNYGLTIKEAIISTVIIISSILLIRFCKNLTTQIYKAWTKENGLDHGLRIVVSNTPSPYSFFNTLFVPRGMDVDSIPVEILKHEQSHWRNLHSLDLIIVELLVALHWFNPLVHLYKRALKANHEYTADYDVTTQLGEKVSYIETLLKYAMPQNTDNQLALYFNHSSIQKRIQMITSNGKPLHPFFYLIIVSITLTGLVSCGDLYESGTPDISRDESGFSFALGDSYNSNKDMGRVVVHGGMMPERRQLFPRLVDKFEKSSVHYITFDGSQISNVDLRQYVDISVAFQVYAVAIEDDLYGEYEYRVSLLSAEYYDRAYRKHQEDLANFWQTFRILNSKGDTVLLIDDMKAHPHRYKIDTTNSEGEFQMNMSTGRPVVNSNSNK